MVTDLGGTQISTLMETLPGIAHVLRSPVADAFVNLIRAATRQRDFAHADAEEILRYAVRRNLMAQDECDRVLAEALAATEKRAAKAADRQKARKAATKASKPKPKPHHKASAKASRRRAGKGKKKR